MSIQCQLHNGKILLRDKWQILLHCSPKSACLSKQHLRSLHFALNIDERPVSAQEKFFLSGFGRHCSEVEKLTPLCAMHTMHEGTGFPDAYAKLFCISFFLQNFRVKIGTLLANIVVAAPQF